MLAIFQAEGGFGQGLGHLVRCLSVADALKKQQIRSVFIVRDFPAAKEIVSQRGYPMEVLSGKASSESETLQMLSWIHQADFVFLDGYEFSSDYFRRLSVSQAALAVFDDLMNRDLPVDLVIGNAYAKAEDYQGKLGKSTTLIAGPQYLALRPEFHQLPKHAVADKIRHVLLTFGGEDPHNATEKIVSLLESIPDKLILEVLLGAGYAWEESLQRALKYSPHEVHLHRNLANPAPLFQKVDLAVTAAGTSVWELAAAGTPMMIVKTASNQEKMLPYLQQQGLGVLLGDLQHVNETELKKGLESVRDKAVRQKQSVLGQQLVDGKGAERIASALLHCRQIKSKLELRPLSDLSPEGRESLLLWEWRNDPVTRQMSKRSHFISKEEHSAWFSKAVRDPHCQIRIAWDQSTPIGMMRLDLKSPESADISINIAPESRGKGYGKRLLAAACHEAAILGIQQLDAEVREENLKSIAIFEAVGFWWDASFDGFRNYRLEFSGLICNAT